MPDYRIPNSITQDEFLKALEPLLDRLNVTAEEVTGDLLITPDVIRFGVVAREVGDDRKIPGGFTLESRPQEFAELVHGCVVSIR